MSEVREFKLDGILETKELIFGSHKIIIKKIGKEVTYDIELYDQNSRGPVVIHFKNYQDLYIFTQFLLRGLDE